MDVGRCEFKDCVQFTECYRSTSQSSVYDFEKICNEENNYRWFIKNKNLENSTTNTSEV